MLLGRRRSNTVCSGQVQEAACDVLLAASWRGATGPVASWRRFAQEPAEGIAEATFLG